MRMSSMDPLPSLAVHFNQNGLLPCQLISTIMYQRLH